jgi:hypothetical protein
MNGMNSNSPIPFRTLSWEKSFKLYEVAKNSCSNMLSVYLFLYCVFFYKQMIMTEERKMTQADTVLATSF